MRLSEIKRALAADDIHLTKSLGQNFLHDGNQLRRILRAASVEPSDRVLEIGPGLGSLTRLLVAHADRVLAIEKDARLVRWLEQQFAGTRNLALWHGDALDYLKHEPIDFSDWKLVANLPYSVASQILVELAQQPKCPERIVVTVQLEVAQRIVARLGDRDSGVLTMLVQLQYKPAGLFKIPASCFYPAPQVGSACVTLLRRQEPLLDVDKTQTFARIVKRSFSQRRKMMLKLLKADWPSDKLDQAFEQLQIPQQSRAETLSVEQFVQLTNILHR